MYLSENSTIKISNVLFSKCHASLGGAIGTNFTEIIMYNSSVISNTGSAIYLTEGDTFEINNCTFLNNSTPVNGGAILCNDYCVMKMVNTQFSHNWAGKDGGAVVVGMVNTERYKIMSNLTTYYCSFTHNTAYKGGAMTVSHSGANIIDSNFSHNTATEGIVEIILGNLIMKNCCISNNTIHQSGGFTTAGNGNILMSNCLVFNNTANGYGGVVKSSDCKIAITTSIFKMNTAFGSGGVFYVIVGTMTLRNSSFAKNFARKAGGVFAASEQAVINISESFCFENKAEYSGGVLFTSHA